MIEVGVLVGGDYRVERKLAEGGMGAVFVAEQVSTGAKRALKVIRPELLRNPKLRARFAQEAKVTSRIASDHVVSVVAAGLDPDLGVPWLAMELLAGETLFEMVTSRGALPPDIAITILKQLSHAIDAAHEASVVHRDLKPENVFLATARRSGFPFFVKVLDFGIARIVREAQVTKTESLGTPLWMAPEQAGSGDTVGTWTDIWSFGLIAFFLLTGRSYWLAGRGEGTTLAVVRELCIDPLPPARERAFAVGYGGDLPEAFDAWFANCVSRDVGHRFPSAGVAVASLARAFGLSGSDSDGAMSAPRLSSLPTKKAVPVDGEEAPVESVNAVAHAITEVAPIHAPTLQPTEPPARESAPRATSAPSSVPAASSVAPPAAPSSPPSSPPSIPPSIPQSTPAAPPPVSVTQPSAPSVSYPWTKRIVLGVSVLAVAGLAFLGAGALGASKDREQCRASPNDEACVRACARGDGFGCAQSGRKGIVSRDASVVARSVGLLRDACARGHDEACGTLGQALAFPVGAGLARDPKGAVENLEKSCNSGHMCALAGSLRELGFAGFAKDGAAYFGASCKKPPTSAEGRLDCAWAIAHDLEGPPNGKVSPRLVAIGELDLRGACSEEAGDICGLVWLDKKATPAEVLSAYERGCDAGSALACNNLGALRAAGTADRPPNPGVAAEAFVRACAAGEPSACNNLAFVKGGLVATPRRGPRGATVYKLRCSGGIQVGCAGWGERIDVVPKGTPVQPKDAASAFERACEAGLGTACVNLGALLYMGRGVAQDRARAEKLFAETCFRGDASACGEQGTALLTLRMDHPRDVRAGFGFLERACKGGEEDSCMALYGHMVNGLPDHKREAEGVAGLLRLAAQKIYGLGLPQLYETGAAGLPKDLAEARRVAIAACETESRCTDAAYFVSRGVGGAKEELRAIELLTRGCENDDYPSCTDLGARHREGRGVGKDPTRAVELFKKACDGADPAACDMLSRAYGTAEGVSRDLPRALALARSACENGGAEGCATVGVMTAEGKGTEKNVESAAPYLAFGCRRAVQSACEKLQELKMPLPELDH